MKFVRELLENNFFIPDYQRGYKWETEQVEDLLNDLYDFYMDDKQEFYCLQPLVVKKCSDKDISNYELENKEWYEVIDGQQRLTTIKILLKYLEKIECDGNKSFKSEYGKDHYILDYQRNKETRKFIDNLNLDVYNEPSNIDCVYIKDAYETIEKWVKNKLQETKSGEKFIRESLTKPIVEEHCKKSIKFIYYEIDEKDNPIEVFRRLNSGKIPLTDAELTKALFILNINDNSLKTEVANEWDKIENTLRKEDYWCFLTSKNEDRNIDYQRNRICLLFEFLFQIDPKEKEKKQYKYFSMFEEKINNEGSGDGAYKVWKDNIRKIFNELNYWFNDSVIYNYIGYMVNVNIKITDIKKIWDESNNREDFINEIKNKIKDNLNCKYEDNETMGGYKLQVEYDNKNKKQCEKMLLLLNVQHSISHAQNEEKHSRFDFESYRKSWNIEHIDSKTLNNDFDKEDRTNWLNTELEVLDEETDEGRILKKKIEDFKDSADINDNDKFLRIKEEIEKYYSETDNSEDEFKNNICNLALLGEAENKSYGNNTFPVKRRKIIEWDKEGRFIPICTRYCFLKYFTNNVGNSIKWSKEDKIEYNKYIYETLKIFLSKEENSNG